MNKNILTYLVIGTSLIQHFVIIRDIYYIELHYIIKLLHNFYRFERGDRI